MKPTSNNTIRPILIGITGGIGSGKSYICHQLEQTGHHVFYCDDVAKQIIRTQADVKRELTALVGPDVYDAAGKLVKSVMAAYLCRGTDYSHRIDQIVHPRVAAAFKQQAALLRPSTPTTLECDEKVISLQLLQQLPTDGVLFMECALLFESGFDQLVDKSVVVHVSQETQLKRLIGRDHISREKALRWISLQLAEDVKVGRADYVINNE